MERLSEKKNQYNLMTFKADDFYMPTYSIFVLDVESPKKHLWLFENFNAVDDICIVQCIRNL